MKFPSRLAIRDDVGDLERRVEVPERKVIVIEEIAIVRVAAVEDRAAWQRPLYRDRAARRGLGKEALRRTIGGLREVEVAPTHVGAIDDEVVAGLRKRTEVERLVRE